jgi:TRAP-type C4-dicarboxylate transport system permease small subunit
MRKIVRKEINMLNKAYEYLLKVIQIVCWLIFIVLISVGFFNVLSRFIFHLGLSWSDELSRFLFIWITFLGSVLVNDTYGHMNLDALVTHLSPRRANVVQILATTIVLLIMIILTVGSVQVVKMNWDWSSSALRIPYGFVYSVIPFSFAIMVIQSIVRLIKIIKNFSKGGEVAI